MIHERNYKGCVIRIWGAWNEVRQVNLYQWKVDSKPLENTISFESFNEAYYDACAAIDEWFGQFECK